MRQMNKSLKIVRRGWTTGGGSGEGRASQAGALLPKPGSWLVRPILRRLAPPEPGDELSPEEMEILAPRMQRVFLRWALYCFLWIPPFALVFMYLFSACYAALQPPVVTPIHSDRSIVTWFYPALAAAVACAYPVIRRIQKERWPENIDLCDRFFTTHYGWNQRRAGALLGLFCLFGAAFLCLPAWGDERIVDANGLRFRSGLLHIERKGFDEVRGVAMVDSAGAGTMTLVVMFEKPPAFVLKGNRTDRPAEVLERVAGFISDRCGVPVNRSSHLSNAP